MLHLLAGEFAVCLTPRFPSEIRMRDVRTFGEPSRIVDDRRQFRCFVIFSTSVLLGTAPTSWSTTRPLLKIKSVGMLRMPNFIDTCWLLSTSSLPTFSLPSYSFAISSTAGAIILHGPHHTAQKSTNTGLSDFRTSVSKFASVTSTGFIRSPCRSSLQPHRTGAKQLAHCRCKLRVRI